MRLSWWRTLLPRWFHVTNDFDFIAPHSGLWRICVQSLSWNYFTYFTHSFTCFVLAYLLENVVIDIDNWAQRAGGLWSVYCPPHFTAAWPLTGWSAERGQSRRPSHTSAVYCHVNHLTQARRQPLHTVLTAQTDQSPGHLAVKWGQSNKASARTDARRHREALEERRIRRRD